MNLRLKVCLPILFSSLSLIAAAAPVFGADPGPVSMELKGPGSIRSSRFPHRHHQKIYTCSQCHHSMNAEGFKLPYVAGIEIRKCAFCHNPADMANSKLNSYKLAAHGLCKECHKQNNRTAPTKCSGCHIK